MLGKVEQQAGQRPGEVLPIPVIARSRIWKSWIRRRIRNVEWGIHNRTAHSELRTVVILAGKEIRKLNFWARAISPVLAILRRVLRESRAVAQEGITMWFQL
jgi:hypothetical protein